MKKLIGFVMMVGLVSCSQQDYPILHPDKQKDTAKDYPCGLRLNQYQVVMPVGSHDYDYILQEGDHFYRVKKVCCPEGYTPSAYPGYCH